jgi:quinol monooxygenase YgiN
MVTIIWDIRVRPEACRDGRSLIEQIWTDMRTRFIGYLSHRLLEDQDAPGHYVVVSDWTSRDAADKARDEYAGSEPVRLLQPLLTAPRIRTVLLEAK